MSIVSAAGMFACSGPGSQEMPAPSKAVSQAASVAANAASQPAKAVSQAAAMLPIGEKLSTKNGISLYYLKGSPDYSTAKLTMTAPSDSKVAGPKVKFDFKVENYALQQQTDAPPKAMLANSGKGQHIHLILNNAPYMAKYDAGFEVDLEPDHYVALAFLSRSYHESVKAKTAFAISQFTVGNAKAAPADFTKPHMFYSRPKGAYKGADAKRVMLDFYLVNADLSESGMKVRATVNGSEFMLTKWAPYVLEGLPMGENKIKLELIDASGKAVPGPFNTVERTVTLSDG
ncbi:MAG: phosphopeptide-binding protein [Myxococcota bacterium]